MILYDIPKTSDNKAPVKDPASISIKELVEEMIGKQASDIHINAGSAPLFRIDGRLIDIGFPKFDAQRCRQLTYSILNKRQIRRLEDVGELDFSFGMEGLGRLRANAYVQRGSMGLALRNIPFRIPSFAELGLSKVVAALCERPRGLVLVTGPTGYGKSTTLASMIDYINRKFEKHIITIEDPIEYLHRNIKSMVTQREVSVDTLSFTNALRTILRQDPDVVLVGEMRDLETISAALTIAETGHLTLATLHTNSAVETINRIIDTFDSTRQAQIRSQLSLVIEGIIAQQLIPKKTGAGRVLATEILVPNMAIRNLLREGKVHQIYSIMQTCQATTIMQTMNKALLSLYVNGDISYQEMIYHTTDRPELMEMLNNLKQSPQGKKSKKGKDKGGLFGRKK